MCPLNENRNFDISPLEGGICLKQTYCLLIVMNWFMLSVRMSSYACTRKFGEHERSIRVARGVAESNSNFLSALQTSQVHPELDIGTAKSMNQFFYNIVTIK